MSMRPIVCHISSVHPRYDIRIFEKECQSLANHYTNAIVYLIIADGLGNKIKNGVNIIDVGLPISRFSRLLLTQGKIIQQLKLIKPNIIHIHDPELLLITKPAKKLGCKVIYDVHEDLPKQILNKHYIPQFCRGILSKLCAKIEQYYAGKLDAIVCATELIANRFSQYHNQVVTICNYPLLSELIADNKDYLLRKNHICYIGSISRTRGIEYLIESLAGTNIQLDLAGKFSDISLDELRKINGFDNVNYLGVLNRIDIVELLNNIKIGMVTLLPTPSYIESLPIKMFEYMLAGIPIITSNFPFWQDIVVSSNCGIMVDPSDCQQIKTAINYLLANQDIAINMGQNGKNAVLNKYNWDLEVTKLFSLYDSLIINNKRSSYGNN
jgi:glycosyltransferase involved in cell wall biosynthesis